MADREVVITGLGLVTALGVGLEANRQAWLDGRSATTQALPELENTALAETRVCLPPAFDAAEGLGSRKMLKYMPPVSVLANVAGTEAIRQARLRERVAGEEIGLYAATGLASGSPRDFGEALALSTDVDGCFSCRLFGERALPVINPLLSFHILANMPPCLLSIAQGIKGPSYLFSPWEVQGAAALVEAWQAVRSGEVQAAVVGAADTPTAVSSLIFLRQAGLLGEHECAGAAGAYLVLEAVGTSSEGGPPPLAVVDKLTLGPSDEAPSDPLAGRLGRTFAAAPATLLTLAAACVHEQGDQSHGTIVSDHHKATFELHEP